jgi:hypothetical protein
LTRRPGCSYSQVMQQPPGPKGPQILFTRPAYEWINRVAQKHAEMEKLQLSEKERESLRRWAESEFVYSAARLAGLSVSPAQVSRIVDLAGLEGREFSDAERPIAETLAALRVVETLASSDAKKATLTPDLLIRLNNPLGITGKIGRAHV